MMTFMASTINKMTPWSSLLKSKTTPLRKSLLIRVAPLTFSTGPPTKNFNFRTPPWSRMTSRSTTSLVNKYPPVATSTSAPSFVRGPKPTSYNILMDRPSLNTLGAVVSTPHLAMKFPSPSGDILTIHCDQRLARECYMASLRPQLPIQQTNHIERPPGSSLALSGEDLDPRVGWDVRLEPVEETSFLELPNGHSINLGTGLNSNERAIITPILTNKTYLFAWLATDLPRVDPLVASHKLSIYKEARYVSQKKRKLGEERRLAAKVEADKLLNAGFIEEA